MHADNIENIRRVTSSPECLCNTMFPLLGQYISFAFVYFLYFSCMSQIIEWFDDLVLRSAILKGSYAVAGFETRPRNTHNFESFRKRLVCCKPV